MKRLVKIAFVAAVMISLNSCIGCKLYEDIRMPPECEQEVENNIQTSERATIVKN
jgi:hypothetical protein